MARVRWTDGHPWTCVDGRWHRGQPDAVRIRLLAARVDALTGPPVVPDSTVPTTAFRWKAGRLQQMHSHPGGGYTRWWIDVPTVADDAPDTE